MRVPFLDLRPAPALRAEFEAAFGEVLDAGRFVLGPRVEAFERQFAQRCGVGHCIGVGTGLDALMLILQAMGVGRGDEVIVPAHTFIATWMAVSAVGATPVPVDVDPATANVSADAVVAAFTTATRAVIAVHLYGRPAPVAEIVAHARPRGIHVVEDAAQAHGAERGGTAAGGMADAAAFSFYPVKNLGALGDGGAVTTDDDELAAAIRLLRNYGSRVRGEHAVVGRNSRLDELQAAFLQVRLRHLDAEAERRAALASRYCAALARTGLELPTVEPRTRHAWHLFVVRTPYRDALERHLAEAGVETMIHYPIAPHRQPAYAGLVAIDEVPVAERLQHEVLSLPLHAGLTADEVDHVAAACCTFQGVAG